MKQPAKLRFYFSKVCLYCLFDDEKKNKQNYKLLTLSILMLHVFYSWDTVANKKPNIVGGKN